MLTFAVVVARSGRRIPRRVLDRLRDRACPDVPFDPGTQLIWSNDNESVWFGGWQDATDEGSAAHHWHLDHDGLTAFTGHIWPRQDGWPRTGPWAEQLARHLRSAPLSEGTDELAGIYLAASLHRRGRSSVAADPLGIGQLHWGEGQDLVVVSSRAALAAGLLASVHGHDPKRDAIGAGGLAYSVHSVGLRTGFEQVSVVPEGAVIDIDPATGARMLRPQQPLWRPRSEHLESPERTLETVREEMVTAVRMARTMPGSTTLAGLTGGKDSRLILALLLDDGSAGEVEFETYGADDLPDVVIAREIAKSFGLRLVRNPYLEETWSWRPLLDAAVRDAEPDLSSREITLRISAWTSSGVRSVAEPHLGRLPSGSRVLLSGACGELLRTNYPGSTRFRSKTQVASFLTDLRFGVAGIIRPEALSQYQREMHRLLFEGCLDTDSPQDVLDVFYIRNRLRQWFGTGLDIDSFGRMFPLYSITAVRLAFAIGSENRHAEWIHYQLMHRACEPLVNMAFAGSGWPAGAAGPLTPRRDHHEPAPASPPPSITSRRARPSKRSVRTVRRDRRAEEEMIDLGIMREFLRHDPLNPVFDIIDPVATHEALDRFSSLAETEKMQLYGALTAAIWLGRYEIALPRQIPGAPQPAVRR